MLTEPKPEAKEYKLSDAGGLYLLIRPTGKKYWKYKYRFHGKEKKLSIGVYPEISIKQARKIHQQAKEQLAQGVDPQELKKLEKLQQGQNINDSFMSLANQWFDQQAATWATSTTKKNRAALDNDLLPYLKTRPMSEIKTFELVGYLKRMTDRGALEGAHKARQMLNQIFRYAKHIGMIEHNPASDLVGALPPQKVSHMAAITEPKAFAKLLVDLLLQYTGSNNGHLSPCFELMKQRDWAKGTLYRTKNSLIKKGLIVVTRQGKKQRGSPTLVAITWNGIDEPKKALFMTIASRSMLHHSGCG